MSMIDIIEDAREARQRAKEANLSQADIERIRLEQWNALNLIEEAAIACKAKLVQSGSKLPVCVDKLQQAAAILATAAL